MQKEKGLISNGVEVRPNKRAKASRAWRGLLSRGRIRRHVTRIQEHLLRDDPGLQMKARGLITVVGIVYKEEAENDKGQGEGNSFGIYEFTMQFLTMAP